jgi:hypothetical protein
MTGAPPPSGRGQTPQLPSIPPKAPTASEQSSAIEWDEFSRLSLDEVTKSAASWREGLASITGTAIAGLLLINLPDAADIDSSWKTAVIVIALIAAAAGLVGVWWALSATAGTPSHITRAEFEATYGTIDEFHRKRSESMVTRLRIARIAVAVNITATMLGASVMWLAPSSAPGLRVQTSTETICGVVKSGDQGELHLSVRGERDARVIKLTDVQNLWVVESCDS